MDLTVAFALSFLFTVILLYASFDILLYIPPHIRVPISMGPIGCAIFTAVLILIIIGFVFGRTRISSLGSIGLYLQVLEQFTFPMFFYWTGIAIFLRVLLLPIQVLRLGDIVYVPYTILIFLLEHTFRLRGTTFERNLSLTIIMLGLLTFFFGAATWLYGKFRGRGIIDFWIYRFSRHPQYLGLIIWSYGLLTSTAINLRLDIWEWYYARIPPPSLLWLILTLTLIGSALNEESSLIKKYGEEYVRYRAETPFMIPLPKRFVNFLTMPVRALFRKNVPEHGREIVGTLLIYGLILVLLSTPMALKP